MWAPALGVQSLSHRATREVPISCLLTLAILQVQSGISLWFWFIFLWWLVTLSIFSYTCWLFVCPLEKKKFFFYILNILKSGWFVVFTIQLYEFFTYFEYQPLLGYIMCKCFLQFTRLPFHFVDNFLCPAQVFSLMQSFIFGLVVFASRVWF